MSPLAECGLSRQHLACQCPAPSGRARHPPLDPAMVMLGFRPIVLQSLRFSVQTINKKETT
jgi:hypothetical protein